MSGVGPIDNLPFNLQKEESLIWYFPNTPLYEQRVEDVRFTRELLKGVYITSSDYLGLLTWQKKMKIHLDDGTLGFTNKHIYFTGTKKSFRISYEEIVSYTHYSDGIGVYPDTPDANLQIFVTGDGWFTYNMALNASLLSTKPVQ